MRRILYIIFIIFNTTIFAKDFDIIYQNTLQFEGSKYVNTSLEESKYGISKYYTKNVKGLTKDSATKIAYEKIYKAHRLDEIQNLQLKTFIFDWLYHSSPASAIKNIQKILVKKGFQIEVDGILGSDTIKALNECNESLINDLKKTRLNYLRNLKHYPKYKNNWENRIAKVV